MRKVSSNICILTDSLSKGGAEKAAGKLSQMLNADGYNVTVVTLKNEITYPFSGNLINLGEDNSKVKLVKQLQKTIALKKAVSTVKPDYIIDFRMRARPFMEAVLNRYVFKKHNVINTFRTSNIEWQLPKGKHFENWYKKGKIVAVSKHIKQVLETDFGFNNVNYIPNEIDVKLLNAMANEQFVDEGEYIIHVGRLDVSVKQQDKLLKVYKDSVLPKKNVKLLFLGEGNDKALLENLVKQYNLEAQVKLIGFKDNPYPYIKHAKCLVLSSKFEGMPNVLLEALAVGTPVVSFDCKSGPADIIVNNENGLLIEDQNFEVLKIAIEQLITQQEQLETLQQNTHKYLQQFSPEVVLKAWKQLLS